MTVTCMNASAKARASCPVGASKGPQRFSVFHAVHGGPSIATMPPNFSPALRKNVSPDGISKFDSYAPWLVHALALQVQFGLRPSPHFLSSAVTEADVGTSVIVPRHPYSR